MSYRLPPEEPVGAALRRTVTEQIEKAIGDLEGENPHAAVHETRKRCKKIRAALRLTRDAMGEHYGPENRRFRDIARQVSDLRDRHAVIETLDAVREDIPLAEDRTMALRGRLETARDQLLEELEAGDTLAHVAAALREAQVDVHGWVLPGDGFEMLEPGLSRVYRRGRKALRRARESGRVEDMHEWRKRAKYLRYQLRLLKPVWPRILKAHEKRLHSLTDLLGFEHDLAVLESTMLDPQMVPPGSVEGRQLSAFFAEQRSCCRQQLWPVAQRVYAERRRDFVARIAAYWEAALSERAA